MQHAPTGVARFHAAQRAPAAIIGFLLLMALFIALLFVPGATSLLKVQRATAIPVAATWVACVTVATVAYRATGLSRLYFVLDAIESVAIQTGIGLLLYRSGSAVSILWIAYLCHTQMNAGPGFSRQNLAVIGIGPATAALMFSLNGDPASALLSLLVGVLGAYLYSVMARMQSSLEAALAREAQLKNSLASLRVAEERNRIARDLHDGVAGELTALAWRLRQLPDHNLKTPDGSESEASQLEERVRGALANLRSVVLDLRTEQRSWVDTLAVLRRRCSDLCGSRQLVFDVTGPLEGSLPERAAADIENIVSELVRNATTHAKPARVEVRIQVGDAITLSVSDDGSGLPPDYVQRSSGGLANLQLRVARLRGAFEVQRANPGTHIQVRLPSLIP